MVIKKFGHNLEVDIHGMTVMEAKAELVSLLSRCDRATHEIDVIHGCHGGQALMNFVRKDLKHPRIVKRMLTLNNGMTTLVIKP